MYKGGGVGGEQESGIDGDDTEEYRII